MIRTLIVEDSPSVREFLVQILSKDPQIQVVGTATNGRDAVRLNAELKPDVITMDLNMPIMDGGEAIVKIMHSLPTPIIVVSGATDVKDPISTFRIIEMGALALLSLPEGPSHPNHRLTTEKLIETVKLMSEVKVVTRWKTPEFKSYPVQKYKTFVDPTSILSVNIIAIGASTGGPLVLKTILSGIPKNLSVPILIVQHMAAGFTQGFAEWLGVSSEFPVHLATHNQLPLPGHAYVAPDDWHLSVKQGGLLSLSKEEGIHGIRPSVSSLFSSVAEVYGKRSIGVILTGMGNDGVSGLIRMHEKGAVTIAQDFESSVVHSMPGSAIAAGAITYILSPKEISEILGATLNAETGVSS